jgi:hypothetical protein
MNFDIEPIGMNFDIEPIGIEPIGIEPSITVTTGIIVGSIQLIWPMNEK